MRCTGYFPANGHEYCFPCNDSKGLNIITSIIMLIGILFLWSLLSFGISSRSVAIFLNYLQVINMIQVRLKLYASVTTFGFRTTRRTQIDCIFLLTDKVNCINRAFASSRTFASKHSIPLEPQEFNIEYPTVLQVYAVPIVFSCVAFFIFCEFLISFLYDLKTIVIRIFETVNLRKCT